MEEFDIITYMANMTGFTFTREQLSHIAAERGTSSVTALSELTREQKNLMLADMLFIIFTSYSTTGSTSKSHGDYTLTVGAKTITDKDDIYKLMTALYANPDQELNQVLSSYQGGVSWIDEYD
jgi:hypothetical protein